MVTETVILPNLFSISWKKESHMGLVEFMFMDEVYLQFKWYYFHNSHSLEISVNCKIMVS